VQRPGQLAARAFRKLARIADGSNSNTRIDMSDEYVTWLCYANAGMLDRGNLYCFDYAISHLPDDGPILEIGSFCGLSTNLLTYYKQRHKKRNPLVTCDEWRFENQNGGKVGESWLNHSEYRSFVKDTFLKNVGLFSRDDLPYSIERSSDQFFMAWQNCEKVNDVFGRETQLGGSLSFCYIDGNHSYDYARRDFENCDRHLSPGGFLLFDDSLDGSSWEVCRVIEEVFASDEYNLVIKNPNYLFQKKFVA
jgi:hypothetical protein